MTSSAFDTSQVKDKRDTINGRFQKIKSMAASRRARLNESHRLHQFFRDMDDEESWIKYVLPLGVPRTLGTLGFILSWTLVARRKWVRFWVQLVPALPHTCGGMSLLPLLVSGDGDQHRLHGVVCVMAPRACLDPVLR